MPDDNAELLNIRQRLRDRGIDPDRLSEPAKAGPPPQEPGRFPALTPPDLMPPPNPSPPQQHDRFGRRTGAPLPEKVVVALKVIEYEVSGVLYESAAKVLKDYLESES